MLILFLFFFFFFIFFFFSLAYPKFTESHFAFLDTLCSDHTSTVATLDHVVFRQMLESFKEGLGALDQGICRFLLLFLRAFLNCVSKNGIILVIAALQSTSLPTFSITIKIVRLPLLWD